MNRTTLHMLKALSAFQVVSVLSPVDAEAMEAKAGKVRVGQVSCDLGGFLAVKATTAINGNRHTNNSKVVETDSVVTILYKLNQYKVIWDEEKVIFVSGAYRSSDGALWGPPGLLCCFLGR